MELINKGKKEEWLKQNGGDLAMQLLDMQVSKNYQVAIENDLRNKDFTDDAVESNVEQITNEVIETVSNVVTEVFNTEVIETEENKVVETEVVENTNENEVATTKAFVIENPQEFINLLFTEVIDPLRKEVNELKNEITNIKKEFNNVSKVKEQNVDIEVISTSSLAALLKAKNSDKTDFVEPVQANDPILNSKPKEFVQTTDAQKGTFANFMTGF